MLIEIHKEHSLFAQVQGMHEQIQEKDANFWDVGVDSILRIGQKAYLIEVEGAIWVPALEEAKGLRRAHVARMRAERRMAEEDAWHKNCTLQARVRMR